MAITDENDVKVLVKQTIKPEDLAAAIAAADKKIVAMTGRKIEEWSPSDSAYGQLQSVGAAYAAWTILMGWNAETYLDKAREMRKAFENELNEFRKIALPENKTNPDIVFAESDYSHYKLNPDGRPFLSSY